MCRRERTHHGERVGCRNKVRDRALYSSRREALAAWAIYTRRQNVIKLSWKTFWKTFGSNARRSDAQPASGAQPARRAKRAGGPGGVPPAPLTN